jgi:hypothetical protein
MHDAEQLRRTELGATEVHETRLCKRRTGTSRVRSPARAIIVSARDFRLFSDRDLGTSLELREAS